MHLRFLPLFLQLPVLLLKFSVDVGREGNYCTVHKSTAQSSPVGSLTCWGEVSPGDDRLRTPICHANQGHVAALIHGDVRGDIGDLWWNCEDKRKLDLVKQISGV